MNLWLVTPAWGRFGVSVLCFEQRARLISQLAPRGVTAHCVVIADDDNIDIAKAYGFETIEMENRPVASKVNAGIELAAREGADYVAFVGSDDWLHPDLFSLLARDQAPLDGSLAPPRSELFGGIVDVHGSPPEAPLPNADRDLLGHTCIVSGREITLVDLQRRVMTRMTTPSLHGVIPWLVPVSVLEHCGYKPLQEHLNRGLDYSFYRQIRKAPWVFHDPHPHTRVDLKSDTNITPYSHIGRSLGNSPEAPLDELRKWYPTELVDLAEEYA